MNDKTEKFTRKAREVHGNKYDYSECVYVNATTKVKISCPEHGEFEKTPDKHVNSGRGCNKCSRRAYAQSKVLTKHQWLDKAKSKHGDKYDYSNVVYESAKQKVTIICPKHGEFEQIADDHVSAGKGCRECGIESSKTKQRMSEEEFVARAREVHGDKYSYDNVQYENVLTKVEIVCGKHGSFWQAPGLHLSQANGCSKCYDDRRGNSLRHDTYKFIAKAESIHGDRYDYSKAEYESAHKKVKIVCPVHGEFEKQPSLHLNAKQGCPSCSNQGFDQNSPAILYYFSKPDSTGKKWYKVGITNRTLQERYSKKFLQDVEILLEKKYEKGIHAQEMEAHIKNKFKKLQVSTPEENLMGIHGGYSELYPTNILNL